jgi:hypothetical protein
MMKTVRTGQGEFIDRTFMAEKAAGQQQGRHVSMPALFLYPLFGECAGRLMMAWRGSEWSVMQASRFPHAHDPTPPVLKVAHDEARYALSSGTSLEAHVPNHDPVVTAVGRWS